MQKEIVSKYVVIANGIVTDPYGLKVEVKDQVVTGIRRKDNQVKMRGSYSVVNTYYVDTHCLFSSNLSNGKFESDLDDINKYLKRCEKLHKELTFEVYEMSIEYSAHPYFGYKKFEPDVENDN